jgi:hypothetical protein
MSKKTKYQANQKIKGFVELLVNIENLIFISQPFIPFLIIRDEGSKQNLKNRNIMSYLYSGDDLINACC